MVIAKSANMIWLKVNKKKNLTLEGSQRDDRSIALQSTSIDTGVEHGMQRDEKRDGSSLWTAIAKLNCTQHGLAHQRVWCVQQLQIDILFTCVRSNVNEWWISTKPSWIGLVKRDLPGSGSSNKKARPPRRAAFNTAIRSSSLPSRFLYKSVMSSASRRPPALSSSTPIRFVNSLRPTLVFKKREIKLKN